MCSSVEQQNANIKGLRSRGGGHSPNFDSGVSENERHIHILSMRTVRCFCQDKLVDKLITREVEERAMKSS